MSRATTYNFSPGPSMFPTEVLERAKDELLDWQDGMSILETSHRAKSFVEMTQAAEQKLRKLLDVPEHYRVLFMQGGATLQFAAVPLNLLGAKKSMDYVHSGTWAQKAISDAKRYGEVNIVYSAEADNYTKLAPASEWDRDEQAAYLHYTPNETIHGLEYPGIPEVGDTPLIGDFSSSILSQPLDVSRHALIYAGAQKNIGPSGLAVVIVDEQYLDRASPLCPAYLNYHNFAKSNSLYNTPPTFTWYLVGLVLEWLEKQGGVAAMAVRNRRKADKLYQCLDDSDYFSNPVDPRYRSRMNVPFFLADKSREKDFLQAAAEAGLMNLAGHRALGGMRASIYNTVPEAAVDALCEFLREFERKA